jgi:hypothetical protein
MAQTKPETVSTASRRRRWPLFFFGFLLFLVGPAIYAVQISIGQLVMPWYLPVLFSVGLLLMFVSFLQRRGVLRGIALVLFALLCGFQWYLALVATKTPLYTGPAIPGGKLPAFAAALADGTSFTSADVEKGTPTVLLFFRGRW